MTIEELIEASKKKSCTSEACKAFEKRLAEREKEFEEEHQPITNEWLNKEYTI